MPTYRSNVSDKDQVALENALNDSAIRMQLFDGKENQSGQTKFVRAFDLQAQGNSGSQVTSAVRQFSGSGLCIGSHNDRPAQFDNPGKAV